MWGRSHGWPTSKHPRRKYFYYAYWIFFDTITFVFSSATSCRLHFILFALLISNIKIGICDSANLRYKSPRYLSNIVTFTRSCLTTSYRLVDILLHQFQTDCHLYPLSPLYICQCLLRVFQTVRHVPTPLFRKFHSQFYYFFSQFVNVFSALLLAFQYCSLNLRSSSSLLSISISDS